MNTIPTSWRALAAAVPALVLAFAPVVRAKEGWSTNFEAAKTAAAKEKKDLLMDFTGSDWCEACMMLDKEVFSKDAFKQDVPKHFVLLELDFPQNKELPKAEAEQNEALQQRYHISQFPTVLLADETGRPYAKTGYMPGGPEVFNTQLTELRKTREIRDTAFKKAEAAEGLEKAKALNDGLNALKPDVASEYYQAEIDKVIALDTADTLGRKAKKAYMERRNVLDMKLTQLSQESKTTEFAETIDTFIAKEKITGVDLQDLLFTKLMVLGPGDLPQANALMDEVIKIDPKSELGQRAATVKEKITVMRKQIEESKNAEKEQEKKKEDKPAPAPAPEKKDEK
ncbi:MAG: thioredoxin family protein [Verrucomicrobiota bacterium]